jgi:hypothetical protein
MSGRYQEVWASEAGEDEPDRLDDAVAETAELGDNLADDIVHEPVELKLVVSNPEDPADDENTR